MSSDVKKEQVLFFLLDAMGTCWCSSISMQKGEKISRLAFHIQDLQLNIDQFPLKDREKLINSFDCSVLYCFF